MAELVRVANTGTVPVYAAPWRGEPDVVLLPGDVVTMRRTWTFWTARGEEGELQIEIPDGDDDDGDS